MRVESSRRLVKGQVAPVYEHFSVLTDLDEGRDADMGEERVWSLCILPLQLSGQRWIKAS